MSDVSIIIPVYNGERYLGEAIQSVLDQHYRPLQLIVVDDGSTDGSARIAKSFGDAIRYCYQENQGTASAFNHGLDFADGAYLAFLGADDLWTPEKTGLQMAAFEIHPGVDMVSGHVKQFFSSELEGVMKGKVQFPSEPIPGQVIPAMLIRREAFFRVGKFETHWQVGAEMSWYLRAMEIGLQVMMLPDIVLLRRIHKDNKGITKRHLGVQRVQILKAALDRRRKLKRDTTQAKDSIPESDE